MGPAGSDREVQGEGEGQLAQQGQPSPSPISRQEDCQAGHCPLVQKEHYCRPAHACPDTWPIVGRPRALISPNPFRLTQEGLAGHSHLHSWLRYPPGTAICLQYSSVIVPDTAHPLSSC